MKKTVVVLMLLALALMLSACAPREEAPMPTAAATLAPEATVEPSAAPEAQPEAAPQAEQSPEAPAGKAEYHKITAAEAKARMDSGAELIILDVRTAEEYAEGHIAGAVLLPVDSINADVSELLSDKNAEILVYCRSGNRSRAAANLLVELGYTKVYDFGGLRGWTYGTVTD